MIDDAISKYEELLGTREAISRLKQANQDLNKVMRRN
jgi:hypothetical protein